MIQSGYRILQTESTVFIEFMLAQIDQIQGYEFGMRILFVYFLNRIARTGGGSNGLGVKEW